MRTDELLTQKEHELDLSLMEAGLPDELIVDLNLIGHEDDDFLSDDSLDDLGLVGIR